MVFTQRNSINLYRESYEKIVNEKEYIKNIHWIGAQEEVYFDFNSNQSSINCDLSLFFFHDFNLSAFVLYIIFSDSVIQNERNCLQSEARQYFTP